MSTSRTRTRDEVLVDEVRENHVDRYLLRWRRNRILLLVVVVVVIVVICSLGG
jgi:hypothetical protein